MRDNEPKPDQKILVMVVEDQKDQALLICHILRKHDYRVICVENGLEALELMNSGTVPHILVTDLRMPTLNGIELLETMKGLEISIPTIVMSASEAKSHFESVYRLGVEDYMVKPVSPAQLLARIDKMTNHLKLPL